MRKIRISEAQAKMLKEMGDDTPKNKLLKVTEAQYQKILEMESKTLQTEDELVGVNMPKNKVPSNAVTGNFNKGFNRDVKKQVGKLYEDFLNELYSINEDSGNTYESLIKLMEVAGLIQNGKIKKDKFNNDKARVKEVMSHGLYEMSKGASHYKVMETIENKLSENGGYPAGAEFDSNAPWNEPDYEDEPEQEFLEPSSYPFKMLHYNPDSDGVALFGRDGNLFVHISAYHDGEMLNDFCADPSGADAECINNFVNYVASEDNLQVGLNPFKDILAIVRPENKDEIIKYYGDDEKLMSILNGVAETTTAASSGSFESPMAMSDKFKSNVPEELDEVTTTTSVGGSNGSFAYDAPAGDGSDFWNAGNKLNKKGKGGKVTKGTPISVSENAQKDTQYPGGGFVELDDCTKLNNNKVAQDGGCSQGAIDNVVTTKTSSKSVVAKENVYEAVAKKTGKTIEEVKAIINKSK